MDSNNYGEASFQRPTYQPCFEYRETFEDGRVYHGISAGKGFFHDEGSLSYGHLMRNGAAFSVVKDRRAKSLVAHVNSEGLYYFLLQALPSDVVAHHVSHSYEFDILLKNYEALKSLLHKVEAIPDDHYGSVSELGLFVQDFLLDISIWSSFEYERLYELEILSPFHWHDMQSWTVARNLDDLEDVLSSDSETRSQEIDIDSTPTPNVCNLDVNKQLLCAAKSGNHDVVHALLAFKDGPVNAWCLEVTLNAGHLDIFWLLFNHGAGVGGRTWHDASDLIHIAASHGHLDVVRNLMPRTRIQSLDGVAEYALEAAEIVDYFASLGVNINEYWWGISPLRSAIAQYLVEIGALVAAATNGHLAVVQYLVEIGAKLNDRALVAAAGNGHLAVVQYLVEIGAKLNGQALVAAVKRHDLPMAKYLLEHGADANSSELGSWFTSGSTPALTIAIIENDIRMFQVLLKHGADVNAGNCLHRRPIFAAVRANNIEFTMSLLQQGVSITESEQLKLIQSKQPGYQPSSCWIYCDCKDDFEDVHEPIINSSTPPYVETERKIEEPRRCPVIAEIRAKERWAIKQRLRESFLRSHNKFLDRSSNRRASDALAMFADGISLPQNVWKRGIESVRRLLNNRLPSTLMEVFGSIQVSFAMRFALDGAETPQNFHEQTDFSADLDRWRLVVPADEQPLFDEIASAVWDESYQTGSHQVDWRNEQETLEYFQKLMTSLISATHASCIIGESFNSGGHRLNTIQERFASCNQVPCENHSTTSLSPSQTFEEHDELRGGQPPILDKWKPASPMVILLTATAFFIIVIAFLSVLRNTDRIWRCPRNITTCAARGSLRRYCYVLILYLGLSSKGVSGDTREVDQPWPSSGSTSVESTPGLFAAGTSDYASDERFLCPSSASGASSRDESTPSQRSPQETPSSTGDSLSSKQKSRPQCPSCLSKFSTVSNLNKHMKTDCKYGKKIQFPCRNESCSKQLTRQSYRIIHEKKRCPFRTHA